MYHANVPRRQLLWAGAAAAGPWRVARRNTCARGVWPPACSAAEGGTANGDALCTAACRDYIIKGLHWLHEMECRHWGPVRVWRALSPTGHVAAPSCAVVVSDMCSARIGIYTYRSNIENRRLHCVGRTKKGDGNDGAAAGTAWSSCVTCRRDSIAACAGRHWHLPPRPHTAPIPASPSTHACGLKAAAVHRRIHHWRTTACAQTAR